MLDKSWGIGSETTSKPRYQSVEYCTHWPVLGSFNNWNIILFTNKPNNNNYFDAVHKVVLYCISDNIYSLVHNRKYGVLNTVYPTTVVYYVVKFLSEPYTLQDEKKDDKQVRKASGIILKA